MTVTGLFQYSCRLLACIFVGERALSQVFSRNFAQILRASFSRSALSGCFQMQIFLLLIFLNLNVDFYDFRSSHRVEGVLLYGNSTNMCFVIGCSKVGVEVSRMNKVDFIFSGVAGLQSSALLGTPLGLVFRNYVSISVLK